MTITLISNEPSCKQFLDTAWDMAGLGYNIKPRWIKKIKKHHTILTSIVYRYTVNKALDKIIELNRFVMTWSLARQGQGGLRHPVNLL